jgi:PAS domain S-box-containing protein
MLSKSPYGLPSLARAEVAMKNRRKAGAEAVPDLSRGTLRLNEPKPAPPGRGRSAYELRTSEARYRQALEATQTALTRTEALYRVSTALVAANSVGELLHRVVDVVAEVLPAYRVHLMAVDMERRLVTGHYRGGPGGGPSADIDYAEMMEGLGGWVLTHRVATLSLGGVPDPRESPRVVARRDRSRLGPMIVAPLLYGDRALGIIVASRPSDQPDFVQTDVDLLSAMAGQAAVAIESAAVHDQTQTALTRTEALYHVSTALVAADSVGELLHRVVDVVAEALPAYRVHLMAVDMEHHVVTGHYRGGPGAEPPADMDYAEMMEGLGGWVLTHRVATLSRGDVPDSRESQRVVARREDGRLGPMIVAPILYGDRPLGIIVAMRSSDQPEFVHTDVDLLSAMAGQAAVAIESAAVHDQLKAAHQELEDRVAQRTAQLAESEDRYRRITETITDYVVRVQVIGGAAISTRHGPGCVAVTGYTAEDFARDPGLWLRLVVPEDRSLVLEQTADVEANRHMRAVEHRILRKDGSLRWVRSTPVPQYAPDGTLLGYDGLIQDITERRALEEQLIQAQKMESIGRLAGGVAHDFNNLLTAIMGNAELALMDLGDDHPARENIAEVVKAAEGAARLTSQLLAFARKQIIEPVSLDLSAVVAGSLEMLRRLLGEDIEVSAVLDSGLGTVEADSGQIQQLLVNLTVNARDAMPKGGALVIETANEMVAAEYAASHPDIEPGPYVRLSVTDTGTGMTKETMSHLFEPFFTTKGPGKGTGLGLATCHGIVKQNGGHIWVHSELGQGTTVTTILPQTVAAARPAEGAAIPQPPATGTETILVVEDDPSVRRLTVLGLRSHGYTVLHAANAADALEIAARAPVLDMLVTDVIMPGMRGPELAARLRLVRPAAKLLLMSGHTDTMEAFRDPEGRPIQLLQKPFTPVRLARKVREVLDAQ